MRWIGLCLVTTGLCGCLVTDVIDFETPPGVTAGGSCTCATCWDRPFCQARTGDTVERASAGDPCPTGYDIPSVETSRVIAGDERSAVFHCTSPPGREIDDIMGVECREDGPRPRDRIEYVDPCVDVPLCRRIGPAFASCPELPGPGDPLCPTAFGGPRRIVCAPTDGDFDLGKARARDKLLDACAMYGRDVPSAMMPQRYCFTVCAQTLRACALTDGASPVDCEGNCDPDLFDPPETTHSSIVLAIDPSSTAEVTVRVRRRVLRDIVTRDTVHVQGTLALDAPGCGPGQTCEATIRMLALSNIEPVRLGDGRRERTLTEVFLINTEPLEDSITPDPTAPGSRSDISIEPGSTVYASTAISGEEHRQGGALELSEPIQGFIDWDARELHIHTVIGDPDPDHTRIELQLLALLPNLQPTADAGPDQTVECESARGAVVSLSAAGSSDPDGEADLVSFEWSADTGGGARVIAAGRSTDAVLPLGDTRVAVVVGDAAGSSDVDDALIHVVDTAPPVFDEVRVATDCLWAPDHRMQLLRLGVELIASARDACGEEPVSVRVVDAYSNQPADSLGDGSTAPDVRFGGGAVCLRAERQGGRPDGRGYTVVLEASDATGNVSRHSVRIDVPHDQRPETRCTTGGMAPAVDDDDPRCEMPAPLRARGVGASAGSLGARSDADSETVGCEVGGVGVGLWWLTVLVVFLRRRSGRR